MHEQVLAEVDGVFAAGPVTPESLRNMRVLHGAVMETLRMYPIAVAAMRNATRDFEFAGHLVEKDEPLFIAIGRAVATDNDTHRVVLRRVFAKTAGSQRGEGAVEIIGAESKMAIVAVDIAGPEGAGRINGQIACRAPQASQAPLKGGRSIILRPNRF